MASGSAVTLTPNLRNRWIWADRFKSQGKCFHWTGCVVGSNFQVGTVKKFLY